MDIDSALEKIYSLKQFHIKLGLDNIEKLLTHIGNPQKKIRAFHIAGSNGKGSTCAFMASILQEYGYKVGLFSSPHIVRFNERIRINGKEIGDSSIINFLESNREYIKRESPTFFEITTAMAFEYFAKHDIDYAIIETGLGGRLDATNVLNPIASIITTISIEHSHILGDTLQKIAFEKAGIIKENSSVFIGLLPDEAEKEIKRIADERNSKLFKLRKQIISLEPLRIKLKHDQIEINSKSLKGKHQNKNAALAAFCLSETLGLNNIEKFNAGFDNVIDNTGIYGRYQYYGKSNNVIFDAAHNIEGIKAFLDEFQNEKNQYLKKILIFGAMKDKDIRVMLELIKKHFDKIYISSIKEERAAKFEDIKSVANKLNINIEQLEKPAEYIKSFEEENEQDVLCVMGSIYLLGMIQKKLKK